MGDRVVVGPVWFRWTLTVLFLAVAAYCLVRLAAARHVSSRYRQCHRAADSAHGIMSLGMAVMCSPAGGPIPVAGWQAVYLVSTSWFLLTWWQQRTRVAVNEPIGWHGGVLHHVFGNAAMFYMLTAMSVGGHHTAAAPWVPGTHAGDLPWPVVGWVLAGYFVWHATVLVLRARRPATLGGGPLPAILTAPRLTVTCQVFMALGTSYMLVV